MKTKYVCRGLISLYVNFHNNWTMWSTNLHVKIRRWGGGERKKSRSLYFILRFNNHMIGLTYLALALLYFTV